MRSSSDGLRGPRGTMSRRALLQRSAAVGMVGVVPGLLAACGGGGGQTTGGASSTATAPKVGGKVAYFGYQGCDFPTVLKGFYQREGIDIQAAYVTNTPEMAAKLTAGGGDFDLINQTTAEVPFLESSGVEFQPLDLERLSNWKKVERFVELTGERIYQDPNGETVALPMSWGSLGISYDSSQIDAPTSWQQLTEPQFAKRITVLDAGALNYALTANVLGFNSAEMTKDQLGKASEFLKKVLANCVTVSPSWGDISNLLASGQVQAVFASWSAMGAFAAEAGNPHVKTNLKIEEGTIAFVEAYYLYSGAQNVDSVYAIMNEVLEPKVNPEAAASLLLAPVTKGGMAKLPKPVAGLYPSEDELEKFLSQNGIPLNPPATSEDFVTYGELEEAWTQLKNEV